MSNTFADILTRKKLLTIGGQKLTITEPTLGEIGEVERRVGEHFGASGPLQAEQWVQNGSVPREVLAMVISTCLAEEHPDVREEEILRLRVSAFNKLVKECVPFFGGVSEEESSTGSSTQSEPG